MILYVNACTRPESRTDYIARNLLDVLGDYEEVKLENLRLKSVDNVMLGIRGTLLEQKKYDHEMFELARQFATADQIVISAPYWDMSFPSILKTYIENIFAIGIVTDYNEQGIPYGLCKGKKLYYVVTAGGPYEPEYSYGYIKALCERYFGIPEVELISAEMLDIVGFDAEKIVEDTIKKMKEQI